MSDLVSISLPPPSRKGGMSLSEAIAKRRSARDFTPEPISRSQLSQILWATQGISDTLGERRTVPSAGGTYPLEIFAACGNTSVEKISAGVYRYDPSSHSLTLQHEGDVRLELSQAALDQEYVYQAPLDIVICATSERTARSYGARGERYIYVEVGHAGQNLYLQATALGLATVAIGAFYDERVREVLRLDKQCQPIYIMPVGRPA